jgi:hypothetical protein
MMPFEARQNGCQDRHDLRQIIGFPVNFGQIRPVGRKSWPFCETPRTERARIVARSRTRHAVAALVVCCGLG